MHFMRKTPLPYEYGWAGFSCGFNAIKRINELTRLKQKKLNYTEKTIFYVFMDVIRIYESDGCNGIFNVFSR